MPDWITTFVTAFFFALALIAASLVAVIPIFGIIYVADDNIWLGVGGSFTYIAFVIATVITISEVRRG